MQIALSNIDSFINALQQQRLFSVPIEGFSLGAASELAAWMFGNAVPPDSLILPIKQSAHFLAAWRLLNGGGAVLPPKPFDEVDEAFYPLRDKADILAESWSRFVERLAASLKRNGFPSDTHQALAGAFEEMADNVIQHSNFGTKDPANGFAAYKVGQKCLAFTIADVGIGALASLKYNPEYADTPNGRTALDLIARTRASRRSGQGQGNGYKSLFTGLARFNGTVRLRSADGVLTLTGAFDQVVPVAASRHPVPGLQLSVECKI